MISERRLILKEKNYTLTKRACYFAYVAAAPVFALPALLFVTFHEMYGISYTLLGTLVLVNFCTQFSIDMIFTLFSKHFNIKFIIRLMPLLTSLGLLIYALSPVVFKGNEYTGLVIGTFVFSIAAGLGEVFISPIVAAVPSENPDRDMSFLHSLYAWGVLSVIIVSTVFFNLFGNENWMYLTLLFALLPVISFILFSLSPIPEMTVGTNTKGDKGKSRRIGLALCFACIFFGSAAENVMTNWISSYMEVAMEIPKTYGDVFGMAVFALLLGFARTLYAKFGKNIFKVLVWGMAGSAVCYITVGFSGNVIIAFAACIVTGFATSLLWPGTLILMEEKIPNPGVAAYALMAAGGDFGASIAPQLMGYVVDSVSQSDFAVKIAPTLNLSAEQIGMKAGMLVTSVFPIIGVGVLVIIARYFKCKKASE